MKKFSKKHIQIFKRILDKGKYKPTYNDHEPATQTLIKNGIIDWNASFSGLVFTEMGKQIANEVLSQDNIS
jgi:hypothetical protein